MKWLPTKFRWKQLCWSIIGCAVAILSACWFVNFWMTRRVSERIYHDPQTVPPNAVALVLGTSAKVARIYQNPHFVNRMRAAAALYHAGKIQHFILSGDNHIKEYDEPSDMRAALLELNVPESAITLDYAGFRTLDSIARAKAIFQQTKITIVSDDFHLPRALFLADAYGIDAIALASARVPDVYARKTIWREYFARAKAVLDVYVLNTSPKFYGPPVEIKLTPTS